MRVVVEEGSWTRRRHEGLLGNAAGPSSKRAGVPAWCPCVHAAPTRVLSLVLLPRVFRDSGNELLGWQLEERVPGWVMSWEGRGRGVHRSELCWQRTYCQNDAFAFWLKPGRRRSAGCL